MKQKALLSDQGNPRPSGRGEVNEAPKQAGKGKAKGFGCYVGDDGMIYPA